MSLCWSSPMTTHFYWPSCTFVIITKCFQQCIPTSFLYVNSGTSNEYKTNSSTKVNIQQLSLSTGVHSVPCNLIVTGVLLMCWSSHMMTHFWLLTYRDAISRARFQLEGHTWESCWMFTFVELLVLYSSLVPLLTYKKEVGMHCSKHLVIITKVHVVARVAVEEYMCIQSFFRQVSYLQSNSLECTYLNIPGIGPGYYTQKIYSLRYNSGNSYFIYVERWSHRYLFTTVREGGQQPY